MTPEQNKAKTIFLNAVEISTPEERQAYVEAQCGADESLRREVEDLLLHHAAQGAFLEAPVDSRAGTVDLPAPAERPGTVIGPYKLLEQIGEGGMGTVWMAQQTEPVKRLVALKLIKAGMDSKQIIARFEAERQALALMEHSNIARVLDAGTTDGGRPYFVMDLVKGVPITLYCDEHHLTPRQRLELFIPVCQAVQHAHHKGIIHRDLKPSNVLVALYDGKPVPKVIDFGVAKAAGQPLTEKTLVTGFGNIVGTLEYMSPEQAETNQLDIDTRSDIYSLGVLLYELLAGTTPLEPSRMKDAGLLELLRRIREEETPRPSLRLSTVEDLPQIASNRGVEPKKLSGLMRGELDWIVMRALEKDRNRRYETASTFAADVQRYLDDEPVLACPPSVGYRLRKFVRRNKRTLVSAAVFALALLVVVGSAGWIAWDKSVRQARTADEVEQALRDVESFYLRRQLAEAVSSARRAEAILATGRDNEALNRRVAEWLADLDMVGRLEEIRQFWPDRGQRETHAAYAKAFRDFGIDVENLPAPEAVTAMAGRRIESDLVLSLDVWALKEPKESAVRRHLTEIIGALDPDPWRAQVRQGVAQRDPGMLRNLATSKEATGQSVSSLELLGSALGGTSDDLGDAVAAVAFFLEARQRHPNDFRFNQALAFYLGKTAPAQWDEAIRYGTVAVVLRPGSAAAHSTLAFALGRKGRFEEAIVEARQAIQLKPDYAPGHNALGAALGEKGWWDDALASFEEAVRLQPDLAAARANIGLAWWRKRKSNNYKEEAWGKAEAAYREAIRIRPGLADAHNHLGVLLMNSNRLDEALAEFTEAARLDRNFPQPRFFLGMNLSRTNRLEEGIVALRDALRCDPGDARTKSMLGTALHELAWKLLASPDRQEADVRRALELGSEAVGLMPRDSWAWRVLGVAQYRAWNESEAIVALRQSLAFLPARVELQAESISTFFLAMAHWQLGNKDEARKWYDRAVAWTEKNYPKEEKFRRLRTEAAERLGIDKKKD